MIKQLSLDLSFTKKGVSHPRDGLVYLTAETPKKNSWACLTEDGLFRYTWVGMDDDGIFFKIWLQAKEFAYFAFLMDVVHE